MDNVHKRDDEKETILLSQCEQRQNINNILIKSTVQPTNKSWQAARRADPCLRLHESGKNDKNVRVSENAA